MPLVSKGLLAVRGAAGAGRDAVDHLGLEVELRAQLVAPLRAERGRDEHERRGPRPSAASCASTSPASMVFPRPTSSASTQPPLGSEASANAAASIWCGLRSTAELSQGRRQPHRALAAPRGERLGRDALMEAGEAGRSSRGRRRLHRGRALAHGDTSCPRPPSPPTSPPATAPVRASVILAQLGSSLWIGVGAPAPGRLTSPPARGYIGQPCRSSSTARSATSRTAPPWPALLAHLGVKAQRVAVEVNEAVVTKDRYEAHALRAGDAVEIVAFVGGG